MIRRDNWCFDSKCHHEPPGTTGQACRRTVWTPEQDQLASLWDYADAHGIDIELWQVNEYASVVTTATGLADSQREAPLVAFDADYFEAIKRKRTGTGRSRAVSVGLTNGHRCEWHQETGDAVSAAYPASWPRSKPGNTRYGLAIYAHYSTPSATINHRHSVVRCRTLRTPGWSPRPDRRPRCGYTARGPCVRCRRAVEPQPQTP